MLISVSRSASQWMRLAPIVLSLFVATMLPVSATPDLFVTMAGSDEVRRFDGVPVSLSGDLASPRGLAFGPDGKLYVASISNDSIVRFDVTTGEGEVVVGPNDPLLDGPYDLTFGPDGLLYITSHLNHKILRCDLDGNLEAFASAGLENPRFLVFGPPPNQNLFVSNTRSNEVLQFDGSSGLPLGAFVGSKGGLDVPAGLLFLSDRLLVCSRDTNEVRQYDPTSGEPLDPPVLVAGLAGPEGLTLGPDQKLYVASIFGNAVHVFDFGLGQLDTFASGLSAPVGLVFAPPGLLDNPFVRLEFSSRELSSGQSLSVRAFVLNGPLPKTIDAYIWIQAPDQEITRLLRLRSFTIPADADSDSDVFGGTAGSGVLMQLGTYGFGVRFVDSLTGSLVTQATGTFRVF